MASSNSHAEQASEADIAQISETLVQISKGEKTAQALENHLTSLEKKLDDLLASFEESERAKVEEGAKKSGNDSQADGDREARRVMK